MKRLSLTIILLASIALLPGWTCGEPLNLDPGFDMWCGDQLCAWVIEKGDVQRVSTWHRSDYGAELIGSDVAISQLVSTRVSCFHFALQADKDEGVELGLEMDFLDDGSVEYSHPLPSNDYSLVEYNINAPTWYDKVRFRITKKGPGRAVVAQVKITSGGDCYGQPIDLGGRPLGVECEHDDQCISERCVTVILGFWEETIETRKCADCSTDTDCDAGESCGLYRDEEPPYYPGCVTAGERVMGEWCLSDAECKTGVCCDYVCSECCRQEDCPEGSECLRRDWEYFAWDDHMLPVPWQCSPGQGRGQAGAFCLVDDDCLSGDCQGQGELRQCGLYGMSCEQDEDCPFFAEYEGNLCVSLGASGGRCR